MYDILEFLYYYKQTLRNTILMGFTGLHSMGMNRIWPGGVVFKHNLNHLTNLSSKDGSCEYNKGHY